MANKPNAKENLCSTMSKNLSQTASSKRTKKKTRKRTKVSDKLQLSRNFNGKFDQIGILTASAIQQRLMHKFLQNESEKNLRTVPFIRTSIQNILKPQAENQMANSTKKLKSAEPSTQLRQNTFTLAQTSPQKHAIERLHVDNDGCFKITHPTESMQKRSTTENIQLANNLRCIKVALPAAEQSANVQMQASTNESLRYKKKSRGITQALSINGIHKYSNFTDHPFEHFADFSLQQINNVLLDSPEITNYSHNISTAEDLERILCHYTLQEIVDYFENSHKTIQNQSNLLAEDKFKSEAMMNTRKLFAGYTLQEIVSSLGDSKRIEIVPKNPKQKELTNMFEMFTGYTLQDVMDYLSEANISSTRHNLLDKRQMITTNTPEKEIESEHNDYDRKYYGEVQLIDPNLQNVTSRYSFTRKKFRGHVTTKNTKECVFQETEFICETNNNLCNEQKDENSILFSKLNSNQYYTVQTLNETIYHTSSLIGKSEKNNNQRHFCLHPEDIDRLNTTQSLALISNNNIELRSDFCQKFGHSDICPYESSCMFNNHDMCPYCGFYCIPRNDNQGKQKHQNYCQWNLNFERGIEIHRMKNKVLCTETCQLCRKVVSEKASIHSRLYGILPNCDHVFCIECAKICRSDLQDDDRRNVIVCRICRVCSPFFAASSRWIRKDEKREFLIGFIESIKSIKCRSCNTLSCEALKGTRICYHGRTIPTPNSRFSTKPLFKKRCFDLKE